MSKIAQPAIVIIVGISGDLAKRKLLPAITQIAASGLLPKEFQIVGISRQKLTVDSLMATVDPEGQAFLRKHLVLYQMDLTNAADYARLNDYLVSIESNPGTQAQRLFYLSIPPQATRPVLALLGASSCNTPHAKLLLEKPFGTDLASAETLIDSIRTHFNEAQTYRIDHYLAKEMAQNIVVFRQSNALLKQTWNNQFISSITIEASENIGIEKRGTFYEQTGALRDVIQSHLLQLAALVLMDLPKDNDWQSIPQSRLAALRAIQPPQDIAKFVRRGQYNGYKTEANSPHSSMETFASLTLFSKDPAWADVPITLTTGKALDRKATEIRIQYRAQQEHEANELTLRIQPNEGASIVLWVKRPGYEHDVQKRALDFSYNQRHDVLPEAYERVFVDALRSDRSLFTTSDEVLASWHILAPVQHAWSMHDDDLLSYDAGTAPDDIR